MTGFIAVNIMVKRISDHLLEGDFIVRSTAWFRPDLTLNFSCRKTRSNSTSLELETFYDNCIAIFSLALNETARDI